MGTSCCGTSIELSAVLGEEKKQVAPAPTADTKNDTLDRATDALAELLGKVSIGSSTQNA